MSDRAMIEASMILHRDSANYLLALARTGELDVAVSKRLLDSASSEPETLIRRLAPQLDIPAALVVDLVVMRELARELHHAAQTFQTPQRYLLGHGIGNIRDKLSKAIQDDFTAEIIFEEWIFLTTESWLFSKTRQAFDAMVEAGGTAINVSKEAFDMLVRKTLKKSNDEPLSGGNRVRAAAKWIAAGGLPLIGIFEPISGAIATSAGSCFLLMDP